MSRLYVLILISLLLFVACSKRDNYQTEFKQIYFQHYPSFIPPSTIIFNIHDSTVSFHRIGVKKRLDFSQFPDTIITRYAPKTFNFKLSEFAYQYLTDSISFLESDLVDGETDTNDGILTNIFFIKNNNEIIDVELHNAETENHRKMILRLLDESKKYAPDSLTLEYLIKLEKYY